VSTKLAEAQADLAGQAECRAELTRRCLRTWAAQAVREQVLEELAELVLHRAADGAVVRVSKKSTKIKCFCSNSVFHNLKNL
jgi:hypothetical protein